MPTFAPITEYESALNCISEALASSKTLDQLSLSALFDEISFCADMAECHDDTNTAAILRRFAYTIRGQTRQLPAPDDASPDAGGQ